MTTRHHSSARHSVWDPSQTWRAARW